MTVGDLRAVLEQLDPTLRILIPGQEWGWADLARASRRTVTFAPVPGSPEMGGWITKRFDEPDAPRERCILLKPTPTRRRPPV
jgi:hypothetical protein